MTTIIVHDEAVDGLPDLRPLAWMEFGKLPRELQQVLYDPCGFIWLNSFEREQEQMNGIARKARYARVKEIRALRTEARIARTMKV